MTYEQIKNLSKTEFKRFCGVKPQLFEEMASVLRRKAPELKNRGGQPKLKVEDQLLIALEYWQEYRTYFHIAQSWRVHESTIAWSDSLRESEPKFKTIRYYSISTPL